MATWERCGNTPYYKRESGGGISYVNPFDWAHISIGVERGNEWEGSASILYRKAPRYDFDLLKIGVARVFGKEEGKEILRSTHGWFADLIRARRMNMPLRDLRKIFHEAPEAERNQVLEGVMGLVAGFDEEAFNIITHQMIDKEGVFEKSITLIAVGKDTPAYRDIGEMKEFFDYSKRFFVADTLELAIEEALGYLGIHEC